MTERKALLLRIDPDLADDLRRWADADLRSLNAQIEFLLRKALMDHRRKTKSDDKKTAEDR